MIIDFHTHIFPPQFIAQRENIVSLDPVFRSMYSNSKAKMVSAPELIDIMDEQGIAISVIQNIHWQSLELCRQTNDYIMESAARFPDRLVGFGMIPLDSPEYAIPEIERCARHGIRGIGEIRPSKEILSNPDSVRAIIQSIMEHNLLLLTHSSEPVGHIYEGKGDITPELLYRFISAFPGLKLICAHWGGGLPFYALMPEVKKALQTVYFDSAASPYLYSTQIYTQVSQLVGEDKILFGTDYPLLKPRRLLSEIDSLQLPQEITSRILSENAAGLLGINLGG